MSTLRTFKVDGILLALRPKEHAVLETLIGRAGKAVSKTALHEHAFGIGDAANAEVVEVYVHRLRKRLHGTGAQIVTLRGLG